MITVLLLPVTLSVPLKCQDDEQVPWLLAEPQAQDSTIQSQPPIWNSCTVSKL